jgi:hypothetical protein
MSFCTVNAGLDRKEEGHTAQNNLEAGEALRLRGAGWIGPPCSNLNIIP